jgi:hypothetical protein
MLLVSPCRGRAGPRGPNRLYAIDQTITDPAQDHDINRFDLIGARRNLTGFGHTVRMW